MWTVLFVLVAAVADGDTEPPDEGASLLQVRTSFVPPAPVPGQRLETTAGRLANSVLALLCAIVAAVAIAQVGAAQRADTAARQAEEAKEFDLHDAARRNDLELLRSRAVRGDVDVRDCYDRTPLHAASAAGHNQVVGFLLHLGASVEATDFDDATPLLVAARHGHAPVVRTLLDAGATAAHVPDNQVPAVLTAELVARLVAPTKRLHHAEEAVA